MYIYVCTVYGCATYIPLCYTLVHTVLVAGASPPALPSICLKQKPPQTA